jgi:hypothetical protein
MEDAIQVFKAAHPKKQSLFIFYQSSAHASSPPDTLKAFDINKTDDRKQQHQHNTIIIPNSNTLQNFGVKCKK